MARRASAPGRSVGVELPGEAVGEAADAVGERLGGDEEVAGDVAPRASLRERGLDLLRLAGGDAIAVLLVPALAGAALGELQVDVAGGALELVGEVRGAEPQLGDDRDEERDE